MYIPNVDHLGEKLVKMELLAEIQLNFYGSFLMLLVLEECSAVEKHLRI